MLNFFSLFNPFSQQYATLDNFQELSTSKKLVICTITVLATFISFPILRFGGVAAFRLATRKFGIIDFNQKQPINSHLAQAAVKANKCSALTLEVSKKESIDDSNLAKRDSFLLELKAWKQDLTLTGNKEEAYQRIKTAYENKNTYLSLNNLYLNKLPKVIGQLTQLIDLYLDYNQLQALPVEIGQLTQLIDLYLDYNQLQSLPVEISQLTQLTELYLSHNQLQALPVEIGQLTQLTSLYLSHNQLQALPVEIGQLTQLIWLTLSDNQLQSLPMEISQLTQLRHLYLSNLVNLRELPLNLGELESLLTLDITGTAIPEASLDAILAQCRAKRNKNDLLIPRLQKWFALSKLDLNESKVADLSEPAQETLKEWLRRLEQTRDYHQVQGRLASLVCQLLTTVFNNSSFQEQFISQAEANNSCCEDRSAMALNEIYTSWKLLMLDSLTLREKLETLIGVAKTLALRTCLLQLINKQEKAASTPITENVEIFLYYETLLKKDLGLITAIDTMRYEQIGRREWIDTESLKASVLTHYLSHLNEIPAFISLAQAESFLKEGYASINERFTKKIEDLGECPKTSNNYATLLLDWEVQIGEIKEEQKNAYHQLIATWIEKAMIEM